MSPESIARKKEERYHKGLKLVEAQHVSPNGAVGQYYVRSASGNGRYLAATTETIGPIGMCECKDFTGFASHNGFSCKHILAAEIYEKASNANKTIKVNNYSS